jgi:hypothetical protein
MQSGVEVEVGFWARLGDWARDHDLGLWVGLAGRCFPLEGLCDLLNERGRVAVRLGAPCSVEGAAREDVALRVA